MFCTKQIKPKSKIYQARYLMYLVGTDRLLLSPAHGSPGVCSPSRHFLPLSHSLSLSPPTVGGSLDSFRSVSGVGVVGLFFQCAWNMKNGN